MAKITRVTSTIFASGAAAQDIEQFGSKVQGGSPVYTSDPAVIQALAAWSDGWSAALVVANKSEYKQDRNAVDYVASYQISYLLQQGIAEYDAGTTYYIGSVVQNGGLFFISLTDTNVGNTPPASGSTANWRNMSAQPTKTILAAGAGTYTPPAGCVLIQVTMVGGGGGSTGNGGNTTFGAFTASGGHGGAGGAGGAAAGGSVNIVGSVGSPSGGFGGSSYFGGAGNDSSAAAVNSGSGAAGGGSGGYVEGSVASPSATAYSVGAAGSGTHAGGSGLIIVTEFYY